MSTVLRVKRRFDQEPLDALVLASKKRKIEAGESVDVLSDVPSTEVLKFAGTIKNQEDDVVEHLKKTLSKEELKANYKQHAIDIAKQIRSKAKEDSRENRYKVVKYFRSVGAASSKDQDDSVMTVIDVEHSTVPDAREMPALDDTEIGYVYDLYYTQTKEDIFLDDELMIHPFEQDLVFDNENENDAQLENDGSSENSNSESNMRNEYPDTDNSDNSVGEDDIRAAVARIKIGDESSDLSSEEDFVYGVDEKDVDTHGYKYAKYKARVKKELGEGESDEGKDGYKFSEDSYGEDKDESDED